MSPSGEPGSPRSQILFQNIRQNQWSDTYCLRWKLCWPEIVNFYWGQSFFFLDYISFRRIWKCGDKEKNELGPKMCNLFVRLSSKIKQIRQRISKTLNTKIPDNWQWIQQNHPRLCCGTCSLRLIADYTCSWRVLPACGCDVCDWVLRICRWWCRYVVHDMLPHRVHQVLQTHRNYSWNVKARDTFMSQLRFSEILFCLMCPICQNTDTLPIFMFQIMNYVKF